MKNNQSKGKQSFKEYLKMNKKKIIIPAIILGVSFFSFYRINTKQDIIKRIESNIEGVKNTQFANNNNYIIRTNTNNMYGFHRADGNNYIIGTADIFLSDENGNRVKSREVKIYAEKDGKKTYFNVYNDRYDFELLLNNVEAGEYTIYAEAIGNNGKTYREKLWIGGHLRKNITVSGMQTENNLKEKRRT